jgi:hypothetical protein
LIWIRYCQGLFEKQIVNRIDANIIAIAIAIAIADDPITDPNPEI